MAGHNSPKNKPRRINADVSATARQTIDEYRFKTGKSIAATVETSLSILQFVEDTRAEGGELAVIEPDGSVRKVQFL